MSPPPDTPGQPSVQEGRPGAAGISLVPEPTAEQDVSLKHAMDWRWLLAVPELGLETMLQAVPFQRSTNV